MAQSLSNALVLTWDTCCQSSRIRICTHDTLSLSLQLGREFLSLVTAVLLSSREDKISKSAPFYLGSVCDLAGAFTTQASLNGS